ncbi:MAG: hypothetical protein ACT4N2_12380 [Hyphomicrobium sp.]
MSTLRPTGCSLAAVLVAMSLAACAVDQQDAKSVTTGSLKPQADSGRHGVRKGSDETMKAFCTQRHIDYQSGKSPGGAHSIEKKRADDRLCEAIGRQG